MSQKIYGDLDVGGAVSSNGALLSAPPTLVLKDSTGVDAALPGDIPDFLYQGTASVKGLFIGTGCKSIGMMAFNASGLSGPLIIPESVTAIGDLAFYMCNLTGSLIIPESVTFIGMAAFMGCSITSVIVPATISTSGMIFQACASLTDAYLDVPKAITDGGFPEINGWFLSSGLTTVHLKTPAPAGWTLGANQTVGGKTGVTVVQDWI